MKTVLRIDKGLISKHQRCKDEPRFVYLKEQGKQVDFITTDKDEALDISQLSEVIVHSKKWKQIIIKQYETNHNKPISYYIKLRN